jgi:signal transduction histidine kinase
MIDVARLTGTRHLLRSSQVRLALGLVAVFATVNLVSLGFAWIQLVNNAEEQIIANLEQQMSEFKSTDDPQTLATLVMSEAATTDPEYRIMVFVAPNGQNFGNARVALDGGEVEIQQREGGQELSDEGYVMRKKAMARGTLIVGESRAPINETKETLLGLLLLSIFPTLIISLGAGVWMALISARRVHHIESTLEQLTRGDLAARVPDAEQIDDLSRIGAGINRMASAQDASMSALRQVSTDIAHDLKTPIQRIFVLLTDLCEHLNTGAPEADLADRALAEAERAAAVFQSLLMIAQIEGGSAKTRFDRVDLPEILSKFLEIYAPSAEDSGHRLIMAPLPNLPTAVQGDKALIGQLIANLIENALRHTPSSTTISLTVVPKQQEILLIVADDGPGIPEEERNNVLRRLYRLDRSRTTPGNGLGLSLVLAIAELHDARLRLLDNDPGLRVEVSFLNPAGGEGH